MNRVSPKGSENRGGGKSTDGPLSWFQEGTSARETKRVFVVLVYSSSFVMKRFPSQDCVYLRICCGRLFPYVQRASNLVSTGGRGLKTGCGCC